ncbi:MAG TPA: response regulator transcription factor [Bryobacteraceae bacterium]|jgi:DNA-binding NarL/FixJ family response regulator|nr:response regulator transcription factor [Bryobacteraceae bacterium]
MRKPTVVIAEDDVVIREGCLRLTLEPFFEIVAAVEDGRAAVTSVEEQKPDVVLLDVSLPVLRGFDAAREILANHPDIKLLFVSNYAERAYVEAALEMGASGYVLKSRAFAELPDAIRTALSGEFYRPAI